MADGPETGALAGFAAGLMIDLFLQTTPLGLSALAYCLIGFTVGTMRRTVIREGWWLTPLTALVGSGAGVGLFVVIGVMVGQSQLTALSTSTLVQIASIVAVVNAVLAVPVIRVVAWATAGQGTGASAGVGAGSLSSGTSASPGPAHIRIGRTIR
jgi:rod shape-determining protein MreD